MSLHPSSHRKPFASSYLRLTLATCSCRCLFVPLLEAKGHTMKAGQKAANSTQNLNLVKRSFPHILPKKTASSSTRIRGANAHQEWEILKPKLRRPRPLRPGSSDVSACRRASGRARPAVQSRPARNASLARHPFFPLLIPGSL